MSLAEKEQVEIDFWRDAQTERPEVDSLENIANKLGDMPVLLERMRPFMARFEAAGDILELGAGQGWASCLLKKLLPQARITATDISEYAIASLPKWERFFNVQVDARRACRAYETGLPDASFDVIFCFAAAHHFVAHEQVFAELARLLRPGGEAFYFHEPSCRRLMHPLAHWRVNRIRPEVPEDVLIYEQMRDLAQRAGLQPTLHPDLSLLKRGPVEMVYYRLMRAIPPLRAILPCTLDYQFTRKG